MDSITKRTIEEDISLRHSAPSLWEVKKREPEIRQVYGHFLPPAHRKLVKGLVAKDFNFPPAYHDASNSLGLYELCEIGERLDLDTSVSVADSIQMRPEKEGAIVYTPYFNGYYVNESAYQILKHCANKVNVESIVIMSGLRVECVLEFLARALTLGIVDVCPS
jgi:hypothetical protein